VPIVRQLSDLVYAGDLEPHQGPLSRGQAIELTHFDGLEFDQLQAGGSRFLECAITDTVFSGGSMKRSRFTEVWMRRIRIVDVDLSESVWDDITVLDSSIAALQAYGGKVHRVVFVGCKLDSLNFREAELSDVDFDDCVLRNVDFSGAKLKNVRFRGTTIDAVDLTGASLSKVDFSAAGDIELITGAQSMRGAIINSHQLITMAPVFAAALGITIVDR
jgi:uncharacterized protein YjbI with pentapeptide repeats